MGFTGRNGEGRETTGSQRRHHATGQVCAAGRRGRKVGWRHQDHVQCKGSEAVGPKGPREHVGLAPAERPAGSGPRDTWPSANAGQTSAAGAPRGTVHACAMGFWGSSQAFSSAEQQFSNANTRAPPAEGGEVNSQLWGSVEWGEHLSLFLYFILHSIKCLLYILNIYKWLAIEYLSVFCFCF